MVTESEFDRETSPNQPLMDGQATLEEVIPQTERHFDDESGNLTVMVTSGVTAVAKNSHRARISLPDGYVAVGGYVHPTHGNRGVYLTASKPGEDKQSWIAASRDPNGNHPHRLRLSVFGLKLKQLDCQILKNLLVVYSVPAKANQAEVEAHLPSLLLDYRLIGGGFFLSGQTQESPLIEASSPSSSTSWKTRCIDRDGQNYEGLHAIALGLPQKIIGFGRLEMSHSWEHAYSPFTDKASRFQHAQHPWLITSPGIKAAMISPSQDGPSIPGLSYDLAYQAHGWLQARTVLLRFVRGNDGPNR